LHGIAVLGITLQNCTFKIEGEHNAETREDSLCLPDHGIIRWRFVDGFGET
jgi:hypothetical protein